MSDYMTLFFAGLFVIVIIRAAILDYGQKSELQHWQLVASSLASHLERRGAKVIIDRANSRGTGGGTGVTILWPETEGKEKPAGEGGAG